MPAKRRVKRRGGLTSDLTSVATKSKSPAKIITENIQFILTALGSYLLGILAIFAKVTHCRFLSQKLETQIETAVTMATPTVEAVTEKTETLQVHIPTKMDEQEDNSAEDSGHDDVGSHSSARATSDEADTDTGVQVSNSEDNEDGNEAILPPPSEAPHELEALSYEATDEATAEALPCEATSEPSEAHPCEANSIECEALPSETQYQHSTRRRNSESDGSDADAEDEEQRAIVTEKLVTQLETMFSDEELAKDGFLLKHVRRRSDGYVSLKLVAGLRKVKQISRDFHTVLEALKLSLKLDVNLEETKVRRMEPLTPYLQSLPTGKDSRGCTPSNTPRPSIDLTPGELLNRDAMKNILSNNRNKRTRTYSNQSAGSSNPGSRNGSFSAQGQGQGQVTQRIPALFDRKITTEDLGGMSFAAAARRGSLPLPSNIRSMSLTTGAAGARGRHQYTGKRNSLATASLEIPQRQPRQKSNSYCEGTETSPGGAGMSAWLQRRMATTRSSEGTIVLNAAIRQPRGPDGTKGFLNAGLAEWHVVVGKGKENQRPE